MFEKELEKYPMENFFVGELCISYSVDACKEDCAHEDVIEMDRRDSFISDGAIYLDSNLDYDKDNRHYERYLALFLDLDDKIICLNDKFNLFNPRIDYFKKLMPFSSCLPKVDYNIPRNVSELEVKKLFNTLFNKERFKSSISLYPLITDTKYSMDNYYIGTLNLYKGHYINGKYESFNLVDDYLLKAGGALELTKESDYSCYKKYLCLFLKQEKLNLLNLNNNQIYNIGMIDNEIAEIMQYNSFYSDILRYNDHMAFTGKNKHLYGNASVRKVLTNFNKTK
jgi:hypothetical protein